MFAIYKKELKTYFKSFFGWLFLAVFSFFSGLYVVLYNFSYGNPYISQTISGLFIIVMFVIPLLTMRVFAEEKKQKTDQLILTSPVSIPAVVIGKFLALATMMLFSCTVLVIGCLIMRIYGQVPFGESVVALLGFWLFGCICISVGMFLSSITEHQFIAAIFTYGIFIFLMLVPSFCKILFGEDAFINKVLSVVDILSPFDKMFSGIIVLSDLFYVLSAISIMLILSTQIFGKNIYKFTPGRKAQFFYTTIGTIAVIVIIVALNVIVRQIPKVYTEFDITNKGWYSITKTTKDFLKTVDEDITIYVIDNESDIDDVEKRYLDQYQSLSKHIKVEYRPVDQYPSFASGYTEDQLAQGSLIIVKGDNFRVISYYDLYESTINYQTYSQEMTGIDIEGQITAAISALLSDEVFRVCYTEGHNEISMPASVLKRLKKGGYEAESLPLLTSEIPEDCVALIVNGPNSDFSQIEVEKIKSYVEKGGSLILMASLDVADTPNYDELLSSFGATVTEGTVMERNASYLYMNTPTYLLLSPQSHSITSSVDSTNRLCFFFETRGFVVDEESDEYNVTELFTTSETGYMKVVDENASINYEEGDEMGAYPVAVFSTKMLEDGGIARVVEFGTPGFIYEDFDNVVSKANSDTFMGAIDYITDKTISSSVPAKSVSYDQIAVNTGMVFLYAGIFLILVPLALLITGIVIIIYRRKR